MGKPNPFVMLVDDDAADAFLLERAFKHGSVLVTFKHLRGAGELNAYLSEVEGCGSSASSSAKLPDVILLDINMPAVDGFAVLQDLRRQDPTRAIPVIMFSTSNREEDIERAYRHGANGYLVKPSSIDSLIRLVRSFDDYWFERSSLPALSA